MHRTRAPALSSMAPFLSRTQGSNEGASVAKRVSRGLRAARPSRAAPVGVCRAWFFHSNCQSTTWHVVTTTHLSDSDTGVNGHVSSFDSWKLEWKISTRQGAADPLYVHAALRADRDAPTTVLDRSDSSHLTHPRFPCLLCLARATRGARRAEHCCARVHVSMCALELCGARCGRIHPYTLSLARSH